VVNQKRFGVQKGHADLFRQISSRATYEKARAKKINSPKKIKPANYQLR